MTTRSIENTIMRFLGSFSPSKYAINRGRKSCSVSCIFCRTTGRQLGDHIDHVLDIPVRYFANRVSSKVNAACLSLCDLYWTSGDVFWNSLAQSSAHTRHPCIGDTNASMISPIFSAENCPNLSSADSALAQWPRPSAPLDIRERTKSVRRSPADRCVRL